MRAIVPILLLLLVGCGSKGPECEGSENCPTGEVCSDAGVCIVAACTSSLDCGMEEYCDDSSGQCTAGCLNDRDCLPTHVCDAQQRECVVPGCRSTALDCNFGEFCNPLSGQCYAAGGYYCASCESSEDCGSSSNICLGFNGGTYCGVDCGSGQGCPRGYECVRVRSVGDVTVGYQCIAACWEQGP